MSLLYEKELAEIKEEIRDHVEIMDFVIKKKTNELNKAIKTDEINVPEYLETLLETVYGYIVLKESEQNYDPLSYDFLLKKTQGQARILSGWTDTIDILTNPEEKKLILGMNDRSES